MLVWLAMIFTDRKPVMLGSRTMADSKWASSLRQAAKVVKDGEQKISHGQCAKTWESDW